MELRIIDNLIRTVETFLELAVMELDDNKREAAEKFVAEAEHSIGVIAQLLAGLPDEFRNDKSPLAKQTETLKHAVRELHSKMSTRAGSAL